PVLLWLMVPLLVALSPVRQDGVRYLVPALLALALAAGAGLDAMVGWLEVRWPRARPGASVGAAVLAAASLALACARIHPFYLDFYGAQVGGPATVAERRWFETAWWGEGLADAVAHLNAHAGPGAAVHKACVEPSHLAWLRTDLWAAEVRDPARAEWLLVYAPLTRDCQVPADATLVHEVSARGAPLARLYRRSP